MNDFIEMESDDIELTKNYRLTKYERETIITFNEEEPTAMVYTMNAPMIRKMDNLCIERSDIKCEQKENINGVEMRTYIVPKKWVKVKPPLTRNLTEEQRKELGERMRRIKK